MPDMHTVVADMEQAKAEFLSQFKLSMQWMKDLNVPYEAGVRFHREFFEQNRDFATNLAKLLGRPILIEMWDERFFYFVMKFEFNVVDTMGKADMSTYKVLQASNDLFASSLKTTLPQWRFYPAEAGGHKVKQIVQLPLKFVAPNH